MTSHVVESSGINRRYWSSVVVALLIGVALGFWASRLLTPQRLLPLTPDGWTETRFELELWRFPDSNLTAHSGGGNVTTTQNDGAAKVLASTPIIWEFETTESIETVWKYYAEKIGIEETVYRPGSIVAHTRPNMNISVDLMDGSGGLQGWSYVTSYPERELIRCATLAIGKAGHSISIILTRVRGEDKTHIIIIGEDKPSKQG